MPSLYVVVQMEMLGVKNIYFLASKLAYRNPGHFTDSDGNVALINIMCDMTQFVVVVPVPDETSATLAQYSMQHVLLKLGICHLLILVGGNPFKGVFTPMCNLLFCCSPVIYSWDRELIFFWLKMNVIKKFDDDYSDRFWWIFEVDQSSVVSILGNEDAFLMEQLT